MYQGLNHDFLLEWLHSYTSIQGAKARIVRRIGTSVEESAPRKIEGISECQFLKTVDENEYFQTRGKLQNRLEAREF